MQKITEREISYFNRFFSNEFDFNSEENLETYIYKNLFSYLFSEQERMSIILYASLIDGNEKIPRHIMMIRNIVTRLMQIMKRCDTKIVFPWLNSLQKNKGYASTLLCGYGTSRCVPDERWKTCFYITVPGYRNNKDFSENGVFIVPSQQLILDNMHMDVFKDETLSGLNSARIRRYLARRNKNGLPSFCMALSLDKIKKNILESYPIKKEN